MKLEDCFKQGTEIGSITLVSYFGEFPRKYGNCFTILADGEYYRILNFNYENLQHLIKTDVVSYPIQISILRDQFAVIVDPRIPDEYYRNKFCTSCTPEDLLPVPQRIHQILEVQRGNRKEIPFEMGSLKGKMIKTNVKEQPDLIYVPYTVEPPTDFEILYDDCPAGVEFYNKAVNPDFYKEIKITNKEDEKEN